MRFGRPLVIAAFVLVMAVTPLSAFTSGGTFETWLPGHGDGYGRNPTVRVLLEDHTGLVRAVGPGEAQRLDGPTNPGGNTRVVVVQWLGGCGDSLARLNLDRVGGGYLIEQRTDRSGCSLLIGFYRTVAISLWAPVDASIVEFVSDP